MHYIYCKLTQMKSWWRYYEAEKKFTSATSVTFCKELFLLIGTYIDHEFQWKTNVKTYFFYLFVHVFVYWFILLWEFSFTSIHISRRGNGRGWSFLAALYHLRRFSIGWAIAAGSSPLCVEWCTAGGVQFLSFRGFLLLLAGFSFLGEGLSTRQ